MRTVRRNSREVLWMAGQATKAKSYTLENGFLGRDVDMIWIRDSLMGDIRKFKPSIACITDGKYTVSYHGNHWLEIEVAGRYAA